MNKLANQTTPAQKLPDEEWNFGDQLKDEKNVNLVRGVFFYEYFRCSGKLRKIVLHCRRYYFDEAGKKPRPPVSGWEGYNYNILYPEEKEAIRQKTNGWEIVGDLMQDLMNNRNFPKTPALKILNKDNQNDRKKDCVNSWFCNLDSTQALRFCGEIMGYDGQDGMHLMQQILSDPGIKYCFKSNVQAQEFESVIPVTINWRKPNQQIIEDFINVVLSRRPEEFRKFEKTPYQQVAIGNLCDKLPFRLRNALDWLGVYRRRETVKTWREYFEIYAPEVLRRVKDSAKGISELARPRTEDCRKAKLILDWFENGTMLKKTDFK